jgi:hypothetical protein
MKSPYNTIETEEPGFIPNLIAKASFDGLK